MELIESRETRYKEYETLLLERDQARKEGGQIWTAYVRTFGQMITEVYEEKIECIKCKKTIAYYQNAINHGGVIDADAMREYLRNEMEQYYINLKKMTSDTARCLASRQSTSYEVQRSKTLYRRLAKILHPDINPETDRHSELMELWNRIVTAYGHNDIKALTELEVLVRRVLRDLGLGRTQIAIPDIDEKITELKEEIETIYRTAPYTYGALLEDSDAVEQKKAELAAELEEYRAYRKELNAVIDEILRGGGVTLRWQMK